MTGGARAATIDEVRSRLDRHDWDGAWELLSPAPDAAGGDWWDARADAAWWTGRLDDCIDARTEAYRHHDAAGSRRAAGQSAALLYEHHCFRAQPAIGNGWLRRARRLLDGAGDCLEYGILLIRETQHIHSTGDLVAAEARATEAIDLSRRLGDPSLEADALQALGRILIDQGDVPNGLAHLDEAMLSAVEGRIDPYTTGKVYCSMVGACDEVGDLRRAAEWTDAVTRWSRAHPVSIFPGLCRVHRAGLLQWRGHWSQAEAEVRQGCEELQRTHLPGAAMGFVKLGEIRRRMGDLPGAEEAFRKAEELHEQAWAGLALLRLAQGKVDVAAGIIERALEEASWHRVTRGKLLPVQVQILVAAGQLVAARRGAEELTAIAADLESPVMVAAAELARGRVELAEGNPTGACAALNKALRHWSELDAPYEIATTRQLMGQACRASGDREGAESALAEAEAIFRRLGAEWDARITHDLLDGGELPAGLTAREAEVLRVVAAGRTNRQIAAELHLSEKTVARHLSNIFTKIGVSSRAAATAFAFEHALVD